MDLSIVIISYNTRDLTISCLRSIYAETATVQYEVIVFDNASKDGSADAVKRDFPQVRLIRSSENIGFAKANNVAVVGANGATLLLLNPDTVILDGAIDKLYAFARANPQWHIFGCRSYFGDGSLNPKSCWRRPTPWSTLCYGIGLTAMFPQSNLFARESYGSWRRDSVREVDIVTGCCFLISKELWVSLNGFDPAFFMYAEEADLCLRALKAGFRCAVTHEASIIHYGGASEKVRADKMVRLFRAKAQLFRRHWHPGAFRIGLLELNLWALTRLIAFRTMRVFSVQCDDALNTWRSIWRRRSEWWLCDLMAPERDLQTTASG